MNHRGGDEIQGVLAQFQTTANFIMVELDEGIDPKELLKKILIKHNILIKELMNKTGGKNYLRLAVRNTEDNNKLLAAMKEELGV